MHEKKTSKESLTKIKHFRQELLTLRSLLVAAFDELHAIVSAKIFLPETYVGPHSDYPKRSLIDSGFPIFNKSGFYDETAPKDYLGVIRPKGLLGFFGGAFDLPEHNLQAVNNLKEYLRSNNIGRKFQYTNREGDLAFSDFAIDRILGGAVEKYLHRYGTGTTIVPKGRDFILGPLEKGMILREHTLTLMVPIALTHFDFDRYRLSDSAYLTRIPDKLQLSRARMRVLGSGASEQVVHAATHAFVSNDWTVGVEEVGEITRALSSISDNALDAVDSFFGMTCPPEVPSN